MTVGARLRAPGGRRSRRPLLESRRLRRHRRPTCARSSSAAAASSPAAATLIDRRAPPRFGAPSATVLRMSGLLIDNIGALVTNDPALGARAARADRGRRARPRRRRRASGPARAPATPEGAADERFDAGGRAVIPGFVDRHAPPRVRRRPHARSSPPAWPARPYAAGGIRTTVAGHPRRHRRASSTRTIAPARRRGAPVRHHDDRVQVRLRADRRGRAPLARDRRRPHRRGRPSSAPTSSRPSTPTARRLRRPRLRRDARRVRAARALDRRLLRARRVRRRPDARDPARRRRARPASRACTPTSSATGPGVQIAVELGAASADHVTHLDDADVDALASERHRRDAAARRRVLDPRGLPRRAPAARRGRDRRAGRRLQPGLELHDEHPVLHRARRARDAG